MQQSIRFTQSRDGANLAWAVAGEGPTLVKASNWLTHLEYDWDSPVWRHWVHFLAEHFHCIRYDERGCGMSDWELSYSTSETWFDDLDSVIAAAQPEKPFALLGISQGGAAAINYAVQHPDDVSHLILYGAYARGWAERGDPDAEQRFQGIIQLTRLGWGQNNPVYRQLFTSRFVPDATPEQLDWFNELCRRTTKPEIAAKLLEGRSKVNVVDMLSQLKVPTLVLHARQDEVSPFSEGVLLASRIPDAEFVQLESRNHVLLEEEPAWERFKDEVLRFTGIEAKDYEEDPIFECLSPRERDILVRLAQGCTNAEIGRQLFISEKTVRNNITRIFEKLGVQSRAQAIVLAKDKRLALPE